ncbi:RING finger protein [Ruminococcus flavefaciens]|uniref:RING finger protein n=1 Tax=Ruminococcus flavefaciens TaxID=1265 RepID=UPI00030FF285|nr:RING finger protein [Ruminococcus flavefaciens]
MDYIGEKCPVCEKIFTADDDIVVCPDCGTPHHRSCYAAEKKCANEEYHSTGRKWERMNETIIRFRICPVCRFTNSPDDRNCRRCGTEISDIRPVSENDQRERAEEQWKDTFSPHDNDDIIDPIKYLGYDSEEDMGGVKLREVSDFIGSNTMYYLPKFKRMNEEGARPSINILAMMFPSLFFANRRMWGWAIAAAVLGILFNLPADLLLYAKEYVDQIPGETARFLSNNTRVLRNLGDIGLAVDISARALCCFFSNWLYYRFSMRSLKKLKKRNAMPVQIKRSGCIKPLNMIFILLIKYGLALGAIAAVFVGYEMFSTMKDFSTLSLLIFR